MPGARPGSSAWDSPSRAMTSDALEDAFTGVADYERILRDGRASVHELTRIREEAEVVALWERLENRSPFLGDETDATNGTNGTFPTRPNLQTSGLPNSISGLTLKNLAGQTEFLLRRELRLVGGEGGRLLLADEVRRRRYGIMSGMGELAAETVAVPWEWRGHDSRWPERS